MALDEYDLTRIIDRLAISDVVVRYATAVDGRDWDLYASCFTDPLDVDFPSFSDRPGAPMARSAWVERVRGTIDGFDVTQHLSTNHVATFATDDEATCVSQMQAMHVLDRRQVVLGGYYTNTLVRTPAGWRICRCALTVTWRTGDRALFDVARSRARA
jgi:hypothetical protein